MYEPKPDCGRLNIISSIYNNFPIVIFSLPHVEKMKKIYLTQLYSHALIYAPYRLKLEKKIAENNYTIC